MENHDISRVGTDKPSLGLHWAVCLLIMLPASFVFGIVYAFAMTMLDEWLAKIILPMMTYQNHITIISAYALFYYLLNLIPGLFSLVLWYRLGSRRYCHSITWRGYTYLVALAVFYRSNAYVVPIFKDYPIADVLYILGFVIAILSVWLTIRAVKKTREVYENSAYAVSRSGMKQARL